MQEVFRIGQWATPLRRPIEVVPSGKALMAFGGGEDLCVIVNAITPWRLGHCFDLTQRSAVT